MTYNTDFDSWFLGSYTYVAEVYGGMTITKNKKRFAFPPSGENPDTIDPKLALEAIKNAVKMHTTDQYFTIRLMPKSTDFTNAITMTIPRERIHTVHNGAGAQTLQGPSSQLYPPQYPNGAYPPQSYYPGPDREKESLRDMVTDLKLQLQKKDFENQIAQLSAGGGLDLNNNREFALALCEQLGLNQLVPMTGALIKAKTGKALPQVSAETVSGPAPAPEAVSDSQNITAQEATDKINDMIANANDGNGPTPEDLKDLEAIQGISRMVSQMSKDNGISITEIYSKLVESKSMIEMMLPKNNTE